MASIAAPAAGGTDRGRGRLRVVSVVHQFTMPDNDVVEIDVATLAISRYFYAWAR